MKPRTAESRQIATRSSEVWVAWREIQAQLVDPRGRRAPLTLPAGLGFNEELGCCAVCTSSARRFATCSFSVTNQSFTNVQCFASVGKLNNDMSCLRHPIPSCSCPPAYRVRALSLLHFPNPSLVLGASRYPYEREPRDKYPPFSHRRLDVLRAGLGEHVCVG